jgi:hypothetical protein
MGERGRAATQGAEHAAEEALTDHHLSEVSEMIERARDDESSESPLSERPVGQAPGR